MVYGVWRHFQQLFSYIVAVSFIGWGNRSIYIYKCKTLINCLVETLTNEKIYYCLFNGIFQHMYISKLYGLGWPEIDPKTNMFQLCPFLFGPMKTPIKCYRIMQKCYLFPTMDQSKTSIMQNLLWYRRIPLHLRGLWCLMPL